MELDEVLMKLETERGWTNTEYLMGMQIELIKDIIAIFSNQVEPPVKPESGELSLETMIDNLPQNRILYKDSGLWMIIDEEKFNTTDMALFMVARYQQTSKETFAQFIKRCFDSENGYYIKNY